MRGRLRRSWGLALALVCGASLACFDDDFTLGAYCERDDACGSDQCCDGVRCRRRPCSRGEGSQRAYTWAYMACEEDADCLARGMPHCVRWQGGAGFCADPCFEGALNCERHPSSDARVCVEIAGQSLCALACGVGGFCPAEMTCFEELCVPTS